MSVDTAVARVAQLHALMGLTPVAAPASTPSTSAATGSSDFAARLASVTGTPPTATGAPTSPSASSASSGSSAGAATPFASEIDAAAAKYRVDPALLRGLIRQESNFDANAVSPAGARGLTQLMPGTAAALGVDPSDPAQAIEGGAKYLRQQLDRFGADPAKALAAYNAGPGAVARYGGVPPFAETRTYVAKVLGYAAEYRQEAPAAPAAPAAVATTLPTASSALPYSTT